MSIKAADNKILTGENYLATSCDSGSGGHTPGDDPDPRCNTCGEFDLKETYTITISGMPAICTADTFNGVWTVTWSQNCYWECEIESNYYIKMSLAAPWQIMFEVDVPGGFYGMFYVLDDDYPLDCRPDQKTWEPGHCYTPSGCYGLCDGFYDFAACTVST